MADVGLEPRRAIPVRDPSDRDTDPMLRALTPKDMTAVLRYASHALGCGECIRYNFPCEEADDLVRALSKRAQRYVFGEAGLPRPV